MQAPLLFSILLLQAGISSDILAQTRPETASPKLSRACESSIESARDKLRKYLNPISKANLDANNSSAIGEYPDSVSMTAWNLSQMYLSTPRGRLYGIELVYFSDHRGKMEGLWSSPSYQHALAKTIINSCPQIGIVEFTPRRTSWGVSAYGATSTGSEVIQLQGIDPCNPGSPRLLQWGLILGDC